MILAPALRRHTDYCQRQQHKRHAWRDQAGNWSHTEQDSSSEVSHWRDHQGLWTANEPLGTALLRTLLLREHGQHRSPGCRSVPVMEELDHEPAREEVEKALDALSSGKALGHDGIPPEVLKCAKHSLITRLHELLCQCWSEGSVPQETLTSSLSIKQRRQVWLK